jgi:thiamine-monophosphate kinase
VNPRRLGERRLIDQIKARLREVAPPPPRGIGDDAALLGVPRAGGLLVSTDCLIESQHFQRHEPAYLLGRKALAVNLSDLAAMGGRPVAFLMTLALPAALPPRFLDLLVDGLGSSAREHGVSLVGGDTSMSPGPIVISITILGRTSGRRSDAVLQRSGARAGDGIYVSGALGASATGRLLLQAGWRPRLDARRRHLRGVSPARARGNATIAGGTMATRTRALEALRAHLDPAPRLELGRALIESRIASAAIDISDGLSIDLDRLCEASRAGARLMSPAIPIADSARALAAPLGRDPLHLALHGGEDYELLFTVPASRERLVAGLDAIFIGRITPAARGLLICDARGRQRRLPPRGFDHFAAPLRPGRAAGASRATR